MPHGGAPRRDGPSASTVGRPARRRLRPTVEDVHGLLMSLTHEEWLRPAHADHGSARDLVAHLIGVERLSVRWLDPDDDVPELPDHVAATRDVGRRAVGPARAASSPTCGARRRSRCADAATSGDPARLVSFHGLRSDLDGFLAIRTFELWAHSMDISLATGRPMLTLDDERMLTLSRQLMRVVPLAMARSGTPVPGDRPCDSSSPVRPAAATTSRCADVTSRVRRRRSWRRPHDLCKVATSRLTPEDLHPWLEGDHALADLVLSGLDALALD